MKPKIALVVLITGTLAALIASADGFSLLMDVDRVHMLPLVGTMLLIAVCFGWMGRWDTTYWIKESLPYLGLVGTVYGALLVLPELSHASGDAARWHIAWELIAALSSNLIAVAGIAWLRLLRRICQP